MNKSLLHTNIHIKRHIMCRDTLKRPTNVNRGEIVGKKGPTLREARQKSASACS
jgi:hypothetical protein